MSEDVATGGLLTTQEVADLLRVSRMSVTRWAEAGDLPAIELPSGRRRFRADDIAAFLRSKQSAGDAA